MSDVVVIPVHNQLQCLKVCIESVYKHTNNPKVIIVDDGSTDFETKQWIIDNEKQLGYVRIYHEVDMGFSKACNDGIDFALGHYDFVSLCLLNSDTEVRTPDWFAKVNWYFENGEKIGVASVMSDNALAQTVKNYNHYMANIDTKPAVYSVLLHGFCYFISKELLLKIGKLDEVMFPHYGSEDDYSLMSIKVGFKNLLVGKVFVHHDNAKSYSEAQRSRIVLKSFPDLNKKWNAGFVNKCGILSVKAGNHINNH